MPEDQLHSALHTRFALGEKLTPAEAEALTAWYTAQDQAELEQLSRIKPADAGDSMPQLDDLSLQLRLSVQRVQDLTEQNESLRHNIALLQRHLRSD